MSQQLARESRGGNEFAVFHANEFDERICFERDHANDERCCLDGKVRTVATDRPCLAASSQRRRDGVQRWSTNEVPFASRVDYFAEALSEAIVSPLRVHSANPSTLQAQVSFAQLGAVGVCKFFGSPHRFFRGPSEIARTSEHTVNLMMTLDCAWIADHGGQLRLSPGDVLVHDSRYPVCGEIPRTCTGLSVRVTDAWLREWLPNPDWVGALRISGQSTWGRALSSHLAELSPELAETPPLPPALLADQVGSLLALAARVTGTAASQRFTPALRSLHERVRDCIAQRCTDSALVAADVATSLNVSLRTLHRTLAAAGETFGARLIEARVRVAERMLTSPLFNRVTTAEIGRRAGFSSASHFARAVRLRTGRTPKQFRNQAA